MLSAGMYAYGATPCVKIDRLIGNPCAATELMTRRPVVGSFFDRTKTSTSGSCALGDRSLRLRRRWTNSNATPGRSVRSRCSSW